MVVLNKSEKIVDLFVNLFSLRIICQILEINHKSVKAGHIPRLAAPNDLVGSFSVFCVFVPYIQFAALSAWKLAPQRPIPLTTLFLT